MSTLHHAIRVAVLLVSTVLLAGCGFLDGPAGVSPAEQRSQMMDSWIGHSAKELILSWGPPAKTDTDGDVGRVLTWQRYTGPQMSWDGRQVLRSGYTTTYMFWADGSGQIYNWRHRSE